MSEELIERLQESVNRHARGIGVRRAAGDHLPRDPENDYYCGYEWRGQGAWHRCTEHHSHPRYHGCKCGERLDGQGLRHVG